MTGQELLPRLGAAKIVTELYGADAEVACSRYRALIEGLLEFPEKPATGSVWAASDFVVREYPETRGDVRLFSAPGRTELGGNHTDHNNGKVLAASVQLDAAAAVSKRADSLVVFRSTGYPDVVVNLAHPDGSPNFEADPAERGTTEALIRGIAAQFAARGIKPGGFTASADTTVFPGSGLSSSAAVEVLIAKIFDSFYGNGARSAPELAKMGWKAENLWFGKPCGLMDQLASASGGVIAIDFEDPENPLVTPLKFDPESLGFVIAAVRTGGSHADLTDDYAAIPREMKAVAKALGKETLRECSRSEVLERAAELRAKIGDRPILRALHYFSENIRVDDMKNALEKTNDLYDFEERRSALGRYLGLVGESGKSSAELLQNIWTPHNTAGQGIALALAMSHNFLGHNGASRVHGGGFAGTIQAYMSRNYFEGYRKEMEAVFGPGTVIALTVRQKGVTELLLE
ncbi:MAG: galactokinase [Spirochaetaceae bacterium]|jgi:galactokinase|nr:galactokinase [Spirochaetaceae bacterium]